MSDIEKTIRREIDGSLRNLRGEPYKPPQKVKDIVDWLKDGTDFRREIEKAANESLRRILEGKG